MVDKLDKIILNQLLLDARTPLSHLAQSCEISKGGVHQRVRKLEEQGIITGSHITIDTSKLGYRTMAYVGIFLEKAAYYRPVVKQLSLVKEIVECSFTTGTYSLLIKMICRDNSHLMEVLSNRVQNIEGIARTETFICLEQSIDRMIRVS